MNKNYNKGLHNAPCPFGKFFPSELNRDDLYYMQLAYNEAIDAWNENNVRVGAVVALNGTVIASDHNRVDSMRDPTAHAEILAINKASQHFGDWRLIDSSLYVTKEPCPMCAGAAIMSRIRRVVFAVSDPKMGCLGGAINLNSLPDSNHRVKISSGVLEKHCRVLLQSFFKKVRIKE